MMSELNIKLSFVKKCNFGKPSKCRNKNIVDTWFVTPEIEGLHIALWDITFHAVYSAIYCTV